MIWLRLNCTWRGGKKKDKYIYVQGFLILLQICTVTCTGLVRLNRIRMFVRNDYKHNRGFSTDGFTLMRFLFPSCFELIYQNAI